MEDRSRVVRGLKVYIFGHRSAVEVTKWALEGQTVVVREVGWAPKFGMWPVERVAEVEWKWESLGTRRSEAAKSLVLACAERHCRLCGGILFFGCDSDLGRLLAFRFQGLEMRAFCLAQDTPIEQRAVWPNVLLVLPFRNSELTYWKSINFSSCWHKNAEFYTSNTCFWFCCCCCCWNR